MSEGESHCKDMFGSKLFQERAKRALPILVRQALSGNPIYYSALASELEMSNPRNLNYVLGAVGTTLEKISNQLKVFEIPYIQSLVINKDRKLPGSGFDDFLEKKSIDYHNLLPKDKRKYLEEYWLDIYAFPYWEDVLNACGLNIDATESSRIIRIAATGQGGGGGEGEEHRLLKERVANDPTLVGLPRAAIATKEAPLPSGDKIDVLFIVDDRRVAVEVKSCISNQDDLARGLFQCVKYRAVMKAERGFNSANYEVDALLVFGNAFPHALRSLQNSLHVDIFEVF